MQKIKLISLTILILLSTNALATTIFDFETPESIDRWFSVDDVVMGGISDSNISHLEEGIARFAGEVSLENNGGFASIRYGDRIYDMSDFSGIELRVKGSDDMNYQFRLQTNIARISYTENFVVSDEWQVIRLPFEDFEATFFGQKVPNAPDFNPAYVRSFVFMFSDKQEGEFELLIDSISVY